MFNGELHEYDVACAMHDMYYAIFYRDPDTPPTVLVLYLKYRFILSDHTVD